MNSLSPNKRRNVIQQEEDRTQGIDCFTFRRKY